MSCEICGRGACTRTFHSIAEQEAFDSEAGAAERELFDKIADLELTCRAQTGAITALRAALDQERADNAKLRAFAKAIGEYRLDVADVQEVMEQHGLIEMTYRIEPCGEDCFCRDEYGINDFPLDCYKPTALLSGRGDGGNDE